MDPITTAIVSAIAGGTLKGLAGDAYEALKRELRTRFGADAPVAKAVGELEARPASLGRQATLAEEVTAAGADRDPEIVRLAQALAARLETALPSQVHTQTATGKYIVQAGGQGSIAELNIGSPRRADK